mmetsp:Transcript_91399/g.158180  ORF Transcript_91399/g.158180 Transcript_91399/m.158180 type:complete len:359 (-) Transcript_91399:261-1337(-)
MYRCILSGLIWVLPSRVVVASSHVHLTISGHVHASGAMASSAAAHETADGTARTKLMRSRAEAPLIYFQRDIAGVSQLEQSIRSSPAGQSTAFSAEATTDATTRSAALMILFLVLSLCGLIWMQRKRLVQGSRRELWANIFVLLYVMLTIAVDILIRRSHQQGGDAYSFHPASLVLLIEVAKLAVSCVVAAVDFDNTRRVTRMEFLNVVRLMLPPGICYWLLNLGRYIALAGADLDEYRVWRATDIIFVAVFWFLLFRKVPKFQHVVGIALVFLACLLLHPQISFRLSWAMMATVGLAFMSSLGLVTNELGLKASSETPISIQNIALYVDGNFQRYDQHDVGNHCSGCLLGPLRSLCA